MRNANRFPAALKFLLKPIVNALVPAADSLLNFVRGGQGTGDWASACPRPAARTAVRPCLLATRDWPYRFSSDRS